MRLTNHLCIVMLAAAAGCSQRPDEAPKAAPATAPPPKVTVVKPQKQAVRRFVEQPGTVQAYEETQLFAKLPSFVRRLHADIGQKVEGPRYDSDGNETKPGTLLAELASHRATVVSLNPIRDTLEDFFVRHVTATDVASRDRGLGTRVAEGQS